MSLLRRAAMYLLFTLVVPGSALFAQTAAGEVNGTVTDPSGAVVAGAAVKLVNRATAIETQASTNQDGHFIFINVQPGTYTVTVESAGFKTAQVPAFEVGVNQAVSKAVALSLGEVNQVVEVSSEGEMVQRSSAELGTVIGQEAVHDLPLNGRNFTQLLTLTPGATPVSTAQGSGISFQDAAMTGIPGSSFSKPSIHGQQNRSTLYFLDGIINTDLRGPVYGILPIIDIIQEFKVQGHNDKAEYGGVTGGIVNTVSKSGSNTFHGSAWEFVRNDAFDARNPFTDARAKAPPAFRQNEFGATFGGPIIKNKTFFYGGYEGWRYTKPTQSLQLIPTDAELNGDFTRSNTSNALYNPFSTRSDGSSGFIRDRFMCDDAGNPLAPSGNGIQPSGNPCNKIPAALISPVMQGFLRAYLAKPNYTGSAGYNYIDDRPLTDNANNWQVKVDHQFSENDTAFFRFSQIWVAHLEPKAGTNEMLPSNYHGNNYGGGWVHIFNPNLILDVRAGGLTKPTVFNQAKSDAGIEPMKALGFSDADRWGGMTMTLASPWFTNEMGNRGDSVRGNPDWSISANVNWIKGNHNIRTGYQYIWVAREQSNTYQTFGYGNTQTGNPKSASNTGMSLASALLGLPSSFSGELPDYGEVHFKLATWSAYIQDEWKVRPRLTFTFGLRYDYLTQPKVIGPRLSNALDLKNQLFLIGADSIPDCSQKQQNPCIPGGGFASVPYNDHIKFVGKKSFMPPPVKDNWGPRIGLAWQFRPNTVVRAAYGLYWDALPARSQYAQNDIEAAQWPWTRGFSGSPNNVYGTTLQTITSIEGSFPTPVAPASPWQNLQSVYFDDPDYKDAYSHQWNLEVQHQITPSTMFSAAYVGSKNGRLPYTGRANAAPVASPNGTPLAAIDQLRAIPWMTANLNYSQSIGTGSYNALQAKLERRFANGLMTLLSYTWSKSMDNSSGWFNAENGPGGGSATAQYYNPDSNRSVSSYDVPHFLSWYVVYDLPAGKGKRWLHTGPAAWILGDWQMNSILQARSGQPFSLQVNGDVANISGTGSSLSGYSRPNIVGNPIPANQTANQWFDPSAFAVPVGSFGNFGRNALRSDHVINADLSIFKNVPLGERRNLQLRFEGFNVFNIMNLAAPSGLNISNKTGVGQVTGIVGTPRQLQFGLRFVF